jgi:hypothetical protein
MNDNYSAIVTRIKNIRRHSNADRLNCSCLYGNNVIIGLDTKEGDLGVFFPVESQLSKEFCAANDLIRRKDENGKPAGGMFDENRRVRAQKFRGESSMGFWVPLSYFEKFATHLGVAPFHLREGDEFYNLEGHKVCEKYVVRHVHATGPAGENRKKKKVAATKIVEGQFHFHFDTSQLYRSLDKINPDDIVVISSKWHGTSGCFGNVLKTRKLGRIEKITRFFGVKIQETEYCYVAASRKVIKSEGSSHEGYYGGDLWNDVMQRDFKGRLKQGEMVYVEIVGQLENGKWIQKDYDYGCPPNTNKVFVYRITQTSPDGHVVELSYPQMKARALEIGHEVVPEIYYGPLCGLIPIQDTTDVGISLWRDRVLKHLKDAYVYDQDSRFCKNVVPEEGICLRVEGSEIKVYKLKSDRFYGYETALLDKGEVDMESEEAVDNSEISDINNK